MNGTPFANLGCVSAPLSAFFAALVIAGTVPRAVAAPVPLVVAVDMNPDLPGLQHSIAVAPGATHARNVSIWIFDPSGTAVFRNIGYLGGLDRGIAFGHVPNNAANEGAVTALNVTGEFPVASGHTAYSTTGIQKVFPGAEFHYVDYGPSTTIQSSPTIPAVVMDIALSNAIVGDVFRFYLADGVSIWLGPGHGAFSVQPSAPFDSGGDAVPDGTPLPGGADADIAIAVPPAAFRVDYVDGPLSGGGATIRVVDVDGDDDGDVDLADAVRFQRCVPTPVGGLSNACASFDYDTDGDVDVNDFPALVTLMTGPAEQ